MKNHVWHYLLFFMICTLSFTACSLDQSDTSSAKNGSTNVDSMSEAELEAASYANMYILSESTKENTTQVTVRSKEIEDDFVLDIVLPTNYDASKKYPVIFITDGNWRRGEYASIQKLSADKKIVDVIIVGICYPDSYDFDSIRERDLIDYPDIFLSFLTASVIPYVDEHYSTDITNRTFCGASYGGYFSLYTLLKYDVTKDIFRNYILASPTFYIYTEDEKTLFNLEEELAAKTKELNVNLYLTVGGLEDEATFLVPLKNFEEKLESRNYKGLSISSKIYEDKDHYMVWVPAMLEGIEKFLAP